MGLHPQEQQELAHKWPQLQPHIRRGLIRQDKLQILENAAMQRGEHLDSFLQRQKAKNILALLNEDLLRQHILHKPNHTQAPSPSYHQKTSILHEHEHKESSDEYPQIPGMVITNELGKGGMGRVYKAMDRQLNRDIAVKVLLHPDSDSLMRFDREAKIMATLDHQNIPPIHQKGTVEQGPYLAMKIIPGETLEDIIQQSNDKIPVKQRAGKIMTKVLDAMSYAHERNIIHRDLKPENIMVSRQGQVYVMDWGLAKEQTSLRNSVGNHQGNGNAELTEAGTVMGTLRYMPPEQVEGFADELADIYSLGAILYEVTTGNTFRQYGGKQLGFMTEIMTKRGWVNFPGFPKEFPKELQSIILKAAASDKEQRYLSVKEMKKDLEAFVYGHKVSAHSYSALERMQRWSHKRAKSLTGIAAGLLILSTTGTGFTHFRNRASQAELRLIQVEQQARQKKEETAKEIYTEQINDALQHQNYEEARESLAALQAIIGEKNPEIIQFKRAIEGMTPLRIHADDNVRFMVYSVKGDTLEQVLESEGSLETELPAGPYLIDANHQHFAPYKKVFVLQRDQPQECEVILGPNLEGFAYIPQGRAAKGNREVVVPAFYLQKHHVTIDDYYNRFLADLGVRPNQHHEQLTPIIVTQQRSYLALNTLHKNGFREDMPVINASPQQAEAYIAWYNKKHNARARLPTQEELRLISAEHSSRLFVTGNSFNPHDTNIKNIEEYRAARLSSMIRPEHHHPRVTLYDITLGDLSDLYKSDQNYFMMFGNFKERHPGIHQINPPYTLPVKHGNSTIGFRLAISLEDIEHNK